MQVVDKEAVKGGFAARKKALISLLEHERGHVMAIEMASIRVPFAEVKVTALLVHVFAFIVHQVGSCKASPALDECPYMGVINKTGRKPLCSCRQHC